MGGQNGGSQQPIPSGAATNMMSSSIAGMGAARQAGGTGLFDGLSRQDKIFLAFQALRDAGTAVGSGGREQSNYMMQGALGMRQTRREDELYGHRRDEWKRKDKQIADWEASFDARIAATDDPEEKQRLEAAKLVGPKAGALEYLNPSMTPYDIQDPNNPENVIPGMRNQWGGYRTNPGAKSRTPSTAYPRADRDGYTPARQQADNAIVAARMGAEEKIRTEGFFQSTDPMFGKATKLMWGEDPAQNAAYGRYLEDPRANPNPYAQPPPGAQGNPNGGPATESEPPSDLKAAQTPPGGGGSILDLADPEAMARGRRDFEDIAAIPGRAAEAASGIWDFLKRTRERGRDAFSGR